jgi:xylose isomerase
VKHSSTNEPEIWRTEVNKTIFSDLPSVQFAGTESNDEFSYRWYDAERVVLGKPLREHMRFAVAYWHSLAMNGSDPFGAPTITRPWMDRCDAMQAAREKADAAFDLFRILDLSFFTFHDRDIAPDGDTLRESLNNFHQMADFSRTKCRTQKLGFSGGPLIFSVIRDLCPELPPILIPMFLPTAPQL